MKSLLKRKTESAASQVPAWHPNFRNFEKLPDIKVVRTAFFINGIAALIAVVLLVVTGMREYELFTVNSQIAAKEEFIARDKGDSDQAIALYRQFQETEKRVQAVDQFLEAHPMWSSLLLRFAETRPQSITITQIEFRDDEITLRASVQGDAESGPAEYLAYVDLLNNGPVFSNYFESAQLTLANRDVASGAHRVEVAIQLKEGN